MPLRDTFGRAIYIVDRHEHAKHWARAERKRIEAEFQRLREEGHALKVRMREVEQLEDEIARVRSAS
jgi:hypothetical protein